MPRYHVFRRLMARQYADHGQIMVALSQSVADDFGRFHQVAPDPRRAVRGRPWHGRWVGERSDGGPDHPRPCLRDPAKVRRAIPLSGRFIVSVRGQGYMVP